MTSTIGEVRIEHWLSLSKLIQISFSLVVKFSCRSGGAGVGVSGQTSHPHTPQISHSNGANQSPALASTTPPVATLGFTGVTTCQRFERLTRQQANFVASEDISIGIERKMASDEPAIIPRHLKPQHVELKRRKDEGDRKLHLREEFVERVRPEEEEEEEEVRRTVKIVSSTGESASKSSKKSAPSRSDSKADVETGEPEVKYAVTT